MANAARLALAARRNEVARFTIAVTGIDLSGVNMAMQVRLREDTPGAPLIALATVMTTAAEGLKLDSVITTNGVTTSIIKGRINASTMTDAAKVPYTGEVGDNSCLAYAMQWTLNGDAQTRLYGDFIVVASAFGSDNAPTNRPVGYGGSQRANVGDTGSLTFGDQTINVSLNDADLLMPIIQSATNAIAVQIPALRADITTTRDPWVGLTQKILRGAFGKVTYANGVRSVVSPTLIIASIGNSHPAGQGAPDPSMIPGEQLRAIFAELLPDWTVEHDNYAVPGSWTSQYEGQIAGFSRRPDIVLVGDPMNDGTGNIFMGYEGFVGPDNAYGGYELALQLLFTKIQSLGEESDVGSRACAINLTGHQPHPDRAKANGRLSVTPEVLMTWPQTSLIAFYVRVVFTAADQRITTYAVDAQGGLVPFDLFNQYGNGLFGVDQYLLEFDPNTGSTGDMHQVKEIGADGSWVRVDGTILADKNDGVTSIRQGNFDNETQVWPPLSKAIVQRDYSGTGALVDVSWRHWELAKANRRVALRNAVVTVDSDAIFGRQVLTNADYDTLYAQPPGDDYHSAAWFAMLAAPFRALARDVVNGTIPADRIYS
jgi:hypothetical protein